jgi:hypothetical protein
MHDNDIVAVYAAADEPEAYLVKDLLENMGIRARVVDGTLLGARGALPFGVDTGPQVWVMQVDSERARQIIAKQESQRQTGESSGSAHPWVCPQCGQKVPGNFDTCWNCEHSRIST